MKTYWKDNKFVYTALSSEEALVVLGPTQSSAQSTRSTQSSSQSTRSTQSSSQSIGQVPQSSSQSIGQVPQSTKEVHITYDGKADVYLELRKSEPCLVKYCRTKKEVDELMGKAGYCI